MPFTRRNAAKLLAGWAVLGALPRVASAQVGRGGTPASFHFSFNFVGAPDTEAVAFQEVSGDSLELDFEVQSEGDKSRFVHVLPKGVKHPNLVLKRGIAARDSEVVNWCQTALDSDLSAPIMTRDLQVSLIDAEGLVLRVWKFHKAWPVKWQASLIAPDHHEIAIETVSLAYVTLLRSQ